MTSINVTEFRKNLPSYLNRVKEGEVVYLTNHGKVIARVTPEIDSSEKSKAALKALRKTAFIGDIESPITDTEWTADENNL